MVMRLYIHNPTVVFRARVDMATITYPLAEIDFDTVSVGTFESIEPGMTIVLSGTAFGGDDHGRQRIRKAAIDGTLYIGRSSQGAHDGEVNISDGDFIEAWNDHRVWSKIPFIASDGEVRKDWDIVFDGHTNESPPVANCGPDMAGTVTGEAGELRVQLPPIENTSFPTADGVAITDYLWSIPSGVTLVGGYALTDQVIQVDVNPGFYYISLTVTDANGKTHTSRCRVYARSPGTDLTIDNFQIVSHRITPAGQQIGIRILDDIPASTYPDGTNIMLWQGEPSGPTDRSHMVMSGYHHTDPATILAERTGIVRDTIFECLDTAGKMTTLPGFSGHVDNASSPDNWLQMKDANIDKYLHYLLHWHSTALELADFTWSNIGSLFPFVTLGSQDASLFEQVNKRAGSIVPNHVFVCNTLGQMAIRPDPMVTPSADRTTTVQATLTADDWSSIEYTHQRSPRFHWLRGEAILAHATALQAIFCDAPGSAPGQGLTATPHGEQLARTQDDLNNSEGNRYARLNAPETPFNVRLVSANGGADFGIEPAAMTWVKLTLSAAYAAQRGLSFTEARGLPLEINITYQYERSGLFRDTVMTWERETLGVPAVTYIQPETPPPAPSPPPYDPTPLTPVGGDGFGTFYAMGANKLVQTRSLGADSPIYSDISGSVTGTFYDWILDPWNPTKRGWLLTSDGIWRYTALDTAAPTIEHMLDNTTVQSDTGRASSRFWYKTEASISLENYITALVGTDGTGFVFNRCYSIRSLDGGDTWLYSLIDDTSGGGGRIHPGGGLAVCPRLVGGDIRLQMGAYRGETFVGENIFIYQSDDKGENWAQVKGLVYGGAPTGASCLIFPYHNNTSGLVAWVSFLTTGTAKQLFRTTDGWSSFSTPALPGQADGAHETFVKRLGIEIWPQDQDQVAIWNSENLLFKSTDGSTFTEVTYSGYVPATHGAVVAAGGFAYSGSRYYIMTANRYIFVSIDGGETWIDKSGNIRDIITSNITSGETGFNAAIVPLWVAE